jgi:molybdopterin-guanine dinucleotide biosynthesis protein A
MDAPLYGLVLAGGRSSRMGRDKAALRYEGQTQLERAMALLSAHVARAYVSVRPDQKADALRARFAQI